MNEDLWDRLHGISSETSKGCEWVELLVVRTRLNALIRSILCIIHYHKPAGTIHYAKASY